LIRFSPITRRYTCYKTAGRIGEGSRYWIAGSFGYWWSKICVTKRKRLSV